MVLGLAVGPEPRPRLAVAVVEVVGQDLLDGGAVTLPTGGVGPVRAASRSRWCRTAADRPRGRAGRRWPSRPTRPGRPPPHVRQDRAAFMAAILLARMLSTTASSALASLSTASHGAHGVIFEVIWRTRSRVKAAIHAGTPLMASWCGCQSPSEGSASGEYGRHTSEPVWGSLRMLAWTRNTVETVSGVRTSVGGPSAATRPPRRATMRSA